MEELKKIRVVFYGSPAEAVPVLESLWKDGDVEVCLVVTKEDAPRGRGLKLQPTPVKTFAVEKGIPVLTPRKLSDREFINKIETLAPHVGVCAAFGRIVPVEVINAHQKGIVNIHPSLLPRWRGAAPVQRAIENGDTVTGVTFMLMTEGLDEGPILYQESTEIAPDETARELFQRLMNAAAERICYVIRAYMAGRLKPVPQEGDVSYARKVEKGEGLICWEEPARKIYNKLRAFTPWPGVYTVFQGKRLRIHRGSVVENVVVDCGRPGEIVKTASEGIDVQTGRGLFRITELQMEGRKRITADEFLRGYRIRKGDTLG